MITLLNAIITFWTGKWGPVSAFMAAIMIIYYNVMDIIGHVKWIIASLDGITNPGTTGIAQFSMGPISFINYIIPLDLAVAMLLLWLPLLLICSIIRLTKSFIPTIAS